MAANLKVNLKEAMGMKSPGEWRRPGRSARVTAILLTLVSSAVLLTGCPFGRGRAVEETMIMDDNYFDPDALSVPVGSRVTLRFPNRGALVHNFQLDEFGVNQDVPPGENRTVIFTANRRGTYTFICNVPGHKELGMVGTLFVR